MNTIFCNIGWTKYYSGPNYLDEYEHPKNGGSYNLKNNGLEFNNFRVVKGTCYGYVQPPAGGAVLHNDSHFGTKLTNNGFVDHVRVIWLASAKGTGFGEGTRIIGWYEDAKAYNEYQEKDVGETIGFYFSAKAENCVLLTEEERNFEFSKNIRNTWYVSQTKALSANDQKLLLECDAFIENYSGMINESAQQIGASQAERTYSEGMPEHVSYEQRIRNSIVVARAKEAFSKTHNDRLFCEVCGFDFEKTYGLLGKGFIEAHHIVAFSESKIRSIKINDFGMVCPNCHRMLHRKGNISIADLKEIIKNN